MTRWTSIRWSTSTSVVPGRYVRQLTNSSLGPGSNTRLLTSTSMEQQGRYTVNQRDLTSKPRFGFLTDVKVPKKH
jgi:hypothetical protein